MFLSLFRADGMDDRSPYGDFWFSSLGRRSQSGARVGAGSAMQLSAVYACTRVLAESFAVLPFRLYRPRPDGRGRQLVTNHWLARLMRRPSRYQNAFEFLEMLQGHLVLRGNAFCQIVDDGAGGIAELLPLHPDSIRIDLLDNGSWRYLYSQANGQQTIYRRDQLWHLRGLSSDGIVGLNPIEMQRETIGAGLSAQEYGNRFFANDAKPTGGWIEFSGKFADKTAKQIFKSSWQAEQGGAKRGSVAVLENGMKYHEVGMTNKDSQFLEARGYNRSEIAGMFRVPPHMIADLSRATFSNIEQQSIDFWQNTMLPWTERWEASLEALLSPDENLEVEFDFRNLLRGDQATRGTYLHNMVLDGVLTRNEARQVEGYDPLDGLDVPLVPANERELGAAPAAAPAAPAPAGGGDGGSPADARMAQLLQSQAARLARRFTRAGALQLDARLIAESLAIPLDKAQAWADTQRGANLTEADLTAALIALGAPP